MVRVAEMVIKAGPTTDSDGLEYKQCCVEIIMWSSSFNFISAEIQWRRVSMVINLTKSYHPHPPPLAILSTPFKKLFRNLLAYDCMTSLVSVFLPCSPDMTSKKVAELNSVLLADFHKLLKKYQAVRKIVRILTVSMFAFNIWHLFEQQVLQQKLKVPPERIFNSKLWNEDFWFAEESLKELVRVEVERGILSGRKQTIAGSAQDAPKWAYN